MSESTAPTPIVSPRRRGFRVTAGGAAIVVLTLIILAMGAGGYLLYTNEERALADARQNTASVSDQLSKSQQETKDRQAELDTTRQALTRSQTETADAKAAGNALSDQLAQSKQQTQDAQGQVKGLQTEKDDLSTRLASAEKATQDSQTANTALQAKTRRALAKAQLVDQFMEIGTEPSVDRRTQLTLTWLNSLTALGDPTIDGYLQAFYKNSKDSTPLNKLITYLSGSVVADLQ